MKPLLFCWVLMMLGGLAVAAESPAIANLKKKAEAGDVSTQYNLGIMYATGIGVPMDASEAAKWFRMAAEQGHVGGQVKLGVLYANGEGVPKDATQALKWFRKAAEQGHAFAQTMVGAAYILGNGVVRDATEAHAWLNVARESRDQGAQKLIVELEKEMTREQITEATKRARELWEKYGKKE